MVAGRQALVTGGGRGIGAAIARALTAAGAIVTVAGRGEAALRAAVAAGIAARLLVLDVTGPDVTLGDDIDILVNNAGAVETAPFAKLDRATWDRMISVNLTAVFTMTQAALPGMVARGWGRVINVASTAGLRGYPYVSAYVAAKHGVIGLTRALALETARTGVTVNAVCPGYADTELLRDSIAATVARSGKPEADILARFTAANPQGRLIAPDEVAAAVLYLCAESAGSVTGQSLAIAGGEVM